MENIESKPRLDEEKFETITGSLESYEVTPRSKTVQFATAFLLLLAVWRATSFKTAVLVGLALNSADINEARERLAN